MPPKKGDRKKGAHRKLNLKDRQNHRPFQPKLEAVAAILGILASLAGTSQLHQIWPIWLLCAALAVAVFGAPLPRLAAPIITCVGLLSSIYLTYEVVRTKAFSVKRGALIVDSSPPMQKLFWVAYTDTIICPVSLLVSIRFTNERSIPVMLESFSVEGRKKGSWGWQKIVRVESASHFLFDVLGQDFRNARRWNFEGDLFDRTVAAKNIGAGETIHGWIFLELDAPLESFEAFRFKAKPINGTVSTAPLDLLARADDDSILGAYLRPLPGHVDISALQRVLYSEQIAAVKRKP